MRPAATGRSNARAREEVVYAAVVTTRSHGEPADVVELNTVTEPALAEWRLAEMSVMLNPWPVVSAIREAAMASPLSFLTSD
jgi:hypothetical protein